jgi:hypothetical protein
VNTITSLATEHIGGSAGDYQGLIGVADPDHGRALRRLGRMFMHRHPQIERPLLPRSAPR